MVSAANKRRYYRARGKVLAESKWTMDGLWGTRPTREANRLIKVAEKDLKRGNLPMNVRQANTYLRQLAKSYLKSNKRNNITDIQSKNQERVTFPQALKRLHGFYRDHRNNIRRIQETWRMQREQEQQKLADYSAIPNIEDNYQKEWRKHQEFAQKFKRQQKQRATQLAAALLTTGALSASALWRKMMAPFAKAPVQTQLTAETEVENVIEKAIAMPPREVQKILQNNGVMHAANAVANNQQGFFDAVNTHTGTLPTSPYVPNDYRKYMLPQANYTRMTRAQRDARRYLAPNAPTTPGFGTGAAAGSGAAAGLLVGALGAAAILRRRKNAPKTTRRTPVLTNAEKAARKERRIARELKRLS